MTPASTRTEFLPRQRRSYSFAFSGAMTTKFPVGPLLWGRAGPARFGEYAGCVLALLLFVVFVHVGAFLGGPLGIMGAIGAFIGLMALVQQKRSTVVVGADGISTRWLLPRDAVSFSQIVHVGSLPRIPITLDDGGSFELVWSEGVSSAPPEVEGLAAALRRCHKTALERTKRGSEELTLLFPSSEQGSGSPYRVKPEAWSVHMAVIQDPAAPLAGRIQAARALVACDDRSVVEWLSAWERATVHPSLQKALAKTVRRIRGRWRNSDERDYSWK